MKVKNKARLRAMQAHKEGGEGLCQVFNAMNRMPPGWQLSFYPGEPVSDYVGGGHRYNYDAVCVRDSQGWLIKEVCFPAALDTCSRYTDSRQPHERARVSWAQTLIAACWELREWVLEIGIPGCRESDTSSFLSD